MQIFTIGYEGATQAELIDRLREAGVTLLADVRAVPLSRRPGFSKNILANGLREAGIDYVGLKALGTPPDGRTAARRHDLEALRRIYAGQLELPEALAQAAQLRAIAAERPTALLCFEREPGCCHRSLLVEAVLPEAEAVHLSPDHGPSLSCRQEQDGERRNARPDRDGERLLRGMRAQP